MTRKLWPLVALLLLVAPPLHAAEEGGGPLDVNTGLIIWTFVILAIVTFVLGKYAWPGILGAVERRETHIRELLEGAERDRAEAATLATENRRLMEETRAKVNEALGEARTQAEKMRAEVESAAVRERAERMERAEREIAAAREAALDSVRREAATIAMAAAEKLVRRSLDTEDNRRLVREFLGQMGTPAPRA